MTYFASPSFGPIYPWDCSLFASRPLSSWPKLHWYYYLLFLSTLCDPSHGASIHLLMSPISIYLNHNFQILHWHIIQWHLLLEVSQSPLDQSSPESMFLFSLFTILVNNTTANLQVTKTSSLQKSCSYCTNAEEGVTLLILGGCNQ